MKHLHCNPSLRTARLLLAFCVALLPALAAAPVDAAPAALSREIEPVVVNGVFSGAPVDEVFVYTFTAVDGWEQIVYQVDERDAGGQYVDPEDDVMDANDEVVFMAGDLGEQATEAITETLDIDPTAIYEIEVTNPLPPNDKGWAYIVRSNTLAPDGSLTPYMQDFEPTDQVITADNYVVGWAEDFGGLDYLALFGGPDILDRTKLRAEASAFGQTGTFDENRIATQQLALDKQGPVRMIVHVVPNQQLEDVVSTTTFAYGSYMETETRLDVSSLLDDFPVDPSDIDIDSIRFSMDLLSSATPATYYDENTAGGATIDGNPDAVPGTPFTQAWRQVSLTDGTTVQVFSFAGDLQADERHYYQDNSALGGSAALGDDEVYGDSGIILLDPEGEVFTVNSAQYFLPGTQGNVGATWYGYSQSPLAVTSTNIGVGLPTFDIYLPIVIKP